MKVNQSGTPAPQKNEPSKPNSSLQTAEAKKLEKLTSSPPPRRHSPHSEKINTDSQTEISSKAKELSHVKDLATNTPDVREEKVAELKKKLSDGSYSVNASKVADHLVDEHLSL